MAMTLDEVSKPARTYMTGGDAFTVTEGQHLIIETSPGGEEILGETVPAGKTWAVNVTVHIVET